MKILFHTNTLNYRGTTVAITDYARYNQEILGNESVIAYCKSLGEEKDMGSEPVVVQALSKKFNVIGYETGQLEKLIEKNNIDLTYMIDSGQRKPLPQNCKTAVHAVFQFNDPHGDRYAYVSKWLSDRMTDGKTPYVPHIVKLPSPTGTYRSALGISKDKIVIGRIGGYYTFDIPDVKKYVEQIASTSDRYVFLFVGTEPFVNHPNVKFINEIHDPVKKANFINTCDAMLHARLRGESFGLSIAEFLSLNKPVIAWAGGHDLNHTEMLKGSETLYQDVGDLNRILTNIFDLKEVWSDRAKEYLPENVMPKFNEVFIK